MEITIEPNLGKTIPYLKMGIIYYDNMIVEETPQMVKGRLQLFQESLYFDLEDRIVNDYEEIKEWRAIFKQLGKDPNRYRHSAEALYRRIKKQNYLSSVNSATDLNNFFSLKYRVPVGLYDRSKIDGKIEFRIGLTGETYEGLNGRNNNLEYLLIAADKHGPFGSPFVDSIRTAITNNTKNAIQIVYLHPSLNDESAQQLLASLAKMFTQINGGEFTINLVKS